MVLNKDNYFSLEAEKYFLSNSQYGSWIDCEARTLAKINGLWTDEPTEEMLVGSMLHSWNDGTIEEFKQNNPDIYSSKGPTKGELKSKFLFVNQMINTLENDDFCMYALQGQKEVILTFEMFGCWWKIKIDSYQSDKRLVDLKSTKSIRELVWSNERWAKVSFLEAYNYPRQMAIYCEGERIVRSGQNWIEPLIVAVSKEEPPDKAIISLNDPVRIEKELSDIERNMPRILAVKQGLEEPVRCNRCSYCRSTKKLDKVIFYTELEG